MTVTMFEEYLTFGLDISILLLTCSLILYLTGYDVTHYAGSAWRHVPAISLSICILVLVAILVLWMVMRYICGASILPDYDWRLMFRPDYVEVHDTSLPTRRVKTGSRTSKTKDGLSKEPIPSNEDLDIVTSEQLGSRPDPPLSPDDDDADPTHKKSKMSLNKQSPHST